MTTTQDLGREIQRRRTFAIISHPDAGKTTLTEKLLLYGGAIHEAGAVKARRGQQQTTSDWMELERQRGISITSSALQFEYRGHRVNLLDTPGHQDFSEDTYRTLVAADSAMMLIDGAKGVEAQTVKLFKVCRDRGIPIVTVVNKMDRPTRDPYALMEEVEKVLGIATVPVTWPITAEDGLRGVYERDTRQAHLFERTAHNAQRAPVQVKGPQDPGLAAAIGPDAHAHLLKDLEVLDCIEPFDRGRFLHGRVSPVFFVSALVNFGVENLLQRFIEISPPPGPLHTVRDTIPPDAEYFTGFIYKVAANMDRQHRDRIAFLRVTSGRFERGMSALHVRLDRDVRLSHPYRLFGQERTIIDEAYPGDIVGLINPGLFRVGDVLTSGPPFEAENFPRFAPEIFAQVRALDPSMSKGFSKGLQQLGEEGVVQVFWPRTGAREPILGAVGELQLEVFQYRLESEYNVKIKVERKPFTRARWMLETTPELLDLLPMVVRDESGRPVALFNSDFEIAYATDRYKDLRLLDKPPAEELRA
jgi:peptide chain release factor 3